MNDDNTIGQVLKDMNNNTRNNDMRRQIVYDEATGDFIIKDASTPLEEGTQDATSFAREGFA